MTIQSVDKVASAIVGSFLFVVMFALILARVVQHTWQWPYQLPILLAVAALFGILLFCMSKSQREKRWAIVFRRLICIGVIVWMAVGFYLVRIGVDQRAVVP